MSPRQAIGKVNVTGVERRFVIVTTASSRSGDLSTLSRSASKSSPRRAGAVGSVSGGVDRTHPRRTTMMKKARDIEST
jgi:hypothetical protein